MNIVFITNFNLYKNRTKIKTVGGIETNTKDVIRELKQRGHNVWDLENQKEQPSWLENGVDVIAASTFDPLTYLKVKKFKSKFNQAAVILHAHTTLEDMVDNFLPDKPIYNNLLKLWLRILYGSANLLITPSSFSKRCLESMQKQMTYPIFVVSNGIRIDKFEEKQEYRENFRKFLNKKYSIPIDATIILNVGLSWKKKGVDTFGKIAKALPNYYFVWVGPINKNSDIDEALKLKNVVFTGFYDDIREPYYGADVFLNTSRVENQGIPLIEAAICKLPVVARDLPAYDWLNHDKSCVKAKEVNEFVEGINRIVSNRDFKNKIVETARKTAIDLHDFNKIGDKVENLYHKATLVKKIWDKKRFQKK